LSSILRFTGGARRKISSFPGGRGFKTFIKSLKAGIFQTSVHLSFKGLKVEPQSVAEKIGILRILEWIKSGREFKHL